MGDDGVVARVGGDEFGIVLPDADGRAAFELAEAARGAVELSAPVQGALRCSAGLACYPDDARSTGTLLKLAGGALTWAKDTGRGRARRYDPEHVFVVTEEQRDGFAAMIARPDAIRTVFQPIVGLTSGEAVGYEALARFDGKPGLPPSWWFSEAHRFGLGAALEAQSVRAALAARGRPPGTFLSLNLSPSALASADVMDVAAGGPHRARHRDHRGGARARRRGARSATSIRCGRAGRASPWTTPARATPASSR